MNAGVLAYTPSSQLSVILNKTGITLLIISTGSNPTEQLLATLLPSFFNTIQAPTSGIVRTSSNTSIVSVDTNGLLEGKSHGTATITVTIRDIYGNTAQTTANVTVQNKISLSCELTYQPPVATNQNVTATLTGCNKPITVLPPYEGGQGGS
ncbi:MAG: Ig-like domain-containing protein [Candidatus Peribacteria bacterium]|nr:Ig-like domain-containing protein [Candidatus Peribacteria bacterium]